MVIIFEDEAYKNLFPLTYLHSTFELRIGLYTPLERFLRLYKKSSLVVIAREELGEVLRERYPKLTFFSNQSKIGELKDKNLLFLSGRAILWEKIPEEGENALFFSEEGDLIGFRLNPKFNCPISEISYQKVKAFSFSFLWDLVALNEKVLPFDLPQGKILGFLDKRVIIIGKREKLFLARGAKVLAGNVLNLENGGIYIDEDCCVKPFSYIEGPVYIGKRSQILSAKIRPFTNIGEDCRVGGEVESSILLGYVNKYHEGFLGHSYIGEWVNLGAGTNNSDLKNNYSPVKIRVGRKEMDSGLLKLGCFLGDHTKTAIGTLIPTGAVVGIFAHLLKEGFSPKFIPNFYWDKKRRWRIEEALRTARIVKERRGKKLTGAEENLLKRIWAKGR